MLLSRKIVSIPLILWILIVIRAALLTGVILSTPIENAMLPDSPTYEQPALALLHNGNFASSPMAPYTPEVIRTPGYPLIIASIYAIFGEHRMAVLLLQVLLDAVLIGLIYHFGKYLWSERAGMLSAVLFAFSICAFDQVTFLLSDYSFAFLLTIALLLGCRLMNPGNHPMLSAFAFGLVSACVTMIRPVFYYWIVVLAAWLVFLTIKRKITWTAAAIGILPWIVIVGGWQVRNKILTGDSTFCQIQNVNLYLYRAADIIARKNNIPFVTVQQQMQNKAGEETKGMPAIERYHYMKQQAVSIIKAEPALLLKTQFIGMAKFVFGPASISVYKRAGGTLQHNKGVLGDMLRMPLFDYLRKWPFSHPMLYMLLAIESLILSFLYLSFLISLWKIVRHRKTLPIHLFLIGTFIYFLAVASGPETYSRFRLPVEPILALYAGYAWMKNAEARP
ncbi:glycosyltransferase family 39 protein [bacterium]|nr:glycosyltransferase family 39 protein [bacterium]